MVSWASMKFYRRVIFFAVFSVFIIVLFTCYFTGNGTISYKVLDTFSFSEKHLHGNNDKIVKTILLWRPLFTDWSYGMLEFESAAFDECPVKCQLSRNQSDLEISDAVIFPLTDGRWDPRDAVFKRRKRQQRFIFFILEMAVRAKFYRDLVPFNGFFNWTMSYRRDSDIYFPYGWVEKVSRPDQEKRSLAGKDYSRNHTHLVCWFVSHCHTGSKREWYVQHLAQHVNVSIFGKCGKEMSYEPKCKFYLALENMICIDYVTEKLYNNAYGQDSVPIVYGGADYAGVLPKHSYINIGDFDSPKDLANYIKILDQNDHLYNDYFTYKREHNVRLWYSKNGKKGTSVFSFCNLCSKLHDKKEEEKVYKDIGQWWDYKGRCPQWRPWPKLYKFFNANLLPK